MRTSILAIAAGALLAAGTGLAQTPSPILIDINTGNGPIVGSSPCCGVLINATQTVFVASDPIHGRELWITDGTAANTAMLFDLCLGACSSNPVFLNPKTAAARGVLYFSADDGVNGRELWKVASNGSVAFVKDINPGGLGSNPDSIVFPTGSGTSPGYFAATTVDEGTELWKTDGTLAGTVMVKDIVPGAAGSLPKGLAAGSTRVYFQATTPATGTELFISDGTSDGTLLRADINPGMGGSAPASITQLSGDTMVFSADDGSSGRELWVTTASVTQQVKDINTATHASSSPSALVRFNNKVYFNACTGAGSNICELWVTDGTVGGTTPFKDICSGTGCGGDPTSLAVLGSHLLFFADSTGTGNFIDLWSSDGTTTTDIDSLFMDFAPGFVISGAYAYFVDGSADKLYRTDGTAAGTLLVKNFASAGFVSAGLAGPLSGNRVLLAADDGFSGVEPYIAGPTATSSALANLAPDVGYGNPQQLTDVAGTLYFTAFREDTGRELWRVSDPTQGALLVADLTPGPGDSTFGDMVALNGKLIFAFGPANSREAYVSDGTAQGTHPLKDFGGSDHLKNSQCFSVVGNRLYFDATTTASGNEPWVSDGTDAGTHILAEIGSGNASGGGFCPARSVGTGFVAVGGNVLFAGTDPTRGLEVFRSDGSGFGASFVRDLIPGSVGSSPLYFASTGTFACFAASSSASGSQGVDAEPWCSDGTAQGTIQAASLDPESNEGSTVPGSKPRSFTAANGRVFFSATSPGNGRRIWASDGAGAGAVVLSPSLNPGAALVGFPVASAGSNSVPDPPPLQHVGHSLYFPCTLSSGGAICIQDARVSHEGQFSTVALGSLRYAPDQLRAFGGGDLLMSCVNKLHGRELCRYDSASGVLSSPLLDLAPGIESSNPDQITPAGAYIYFTADDGFHGRELYAVALKDTINRIFVGDFD